MTQTKILSLLFLLLIMFSCNDNMTESNTNDPEITSSVDDPQLELALEITKNFLATNSNSLQTRSAGQSDLVIKSVQKTNFAINLSELELRSNSSSENNTTIPKESDISIYSISFEIDGKAGFSIASGDHRLPDVLALSETGSISDTTYNTGLAMLLRNMDKVIEYKLKNYYLNEIAEIKKEQVITRSNWYNTNKPSMPSGTTTLRTVDDDCMMITEFTLTNGSLVADKGPLLKTQWHQREPFNNYCNNGNSPAGCVPIATAQIMAYFKKPYTDQYWDELTINKTKIESKYIDRIATLIKKVGQGVNVSYGSDSSSANTKDAATYLKSVGISCTYHSTMDDSNFVPAIDNNKPIILAGSRSNPFPLVYTDGHAWVMDGYISYKYLQEAYYYEKYCPDEIPFSGASVNSFSESQWQSVYSHYAGYTKRWITSLFYHMNWGWGGSSDGWYDSTFYMMAIDEIKIGAYKYNQRMITF